MLRSAHLDSFPRDNLPPESAWPEMVFARPELQYPERLNCADSFIDRHLREGHGDAAAIIGPDGTVWSYADLASHVNRICNVLTGRLGMVPGNRVLLRAANTPMMVACYFAVLKAGGVVVASMPLLRAKELSFMISKARISHALCDRRLIGEMELLPETSRPQYCVTFQSLSEPAELETAMAGVSDQFAACDTAQDDVCLIGFTSGTTGVPKGTMHFHRDMLAICDTFSRHVLKPEPSDVFLGSAPLAFTFGLGGSVLFPFHVGAAGLILEKTSPPDLMAAIARFRPSILFTAPTTYRFMLARMAEADLSSLKKCVSAGEALPKATSDAWFAATGIRLIDGIGGTEMLHIFISASGENIRPGATGKAVPGFEAKVVDENGETLPPGVLGRLAVRGPTGCRYLADDRQAKFVQGGWNLTGDTYTMDADGYFWYGARSDDMIVSSGYNIAGPEVEEALLMHEAVLECGVVGAPDAERGQVIRAYVVLKPGFTGSDALTAELQKYVRDTIAPYKYPRQIEYVAVLPRTETGKVQRFRLREMAAR
jgi:2-aminobenzoate-CoA ligase